MKRSSEILKIVMERDAAEVTARYGVNLMTSFDGLIVDSFAGGGGAPKS